MKQTWVLVADSSRARLLSYEPPDTLRELRSFAHPDSRARRADLLDSERGSYYDGGRPNRSAYDAATDPKAHEAEQFARLLVDTLEAERNRHAFDRLYVAAPPSLLGTMRSLYSAPLARLVFDEIDKNLVGLDARAIRAQLPDRP